MLRQLRIKNFDKGLHTQLEPQSIPEQAASSSLNWLTLGDHIELSGGYTIIGTENTGSGKITGLAVGEKVDGTLLPVRTRGKKIEYYTTDWIESGTDTLGTAADGEDVSITPYTSLAGYQMWLSSPNSGLFKMMLANPGSIKDQYDSTRNFKGYIRAINYSLYLWHRSNNKNYLYRSFKDLQVANNAAGTYLTTGARTTVGEVTITIASPAVFSKVAHGLAINDTVYFTTTGALPTGLTVNVAYYVISAGFGADQFEVSATQGGAAINTSGAQSGTHTAIKATEFVGALGSTTYSGTLAAVTGVKTCFNVVFTDGTKTLTDDKNGAFTGDGTGTINYATGAYSVTFSSSTVAPVSVSYQTEYSISQGIADFTYNSTRTAAQGLFLPQATGGDLLSVIPYQSSLFCLHENNAWIVTIDPDDVTVDNIEWRDNIGVDNWRSAIGTGDGVYYIDTKDNSKPKFRLLTLQSSNSTTGANVVPREKSINLNISGYTFTYSVAFEWQDYILYIGSDSTNNNRMFAYNKNWDSYDLLDYNVSCLAEYNGALWAGDALSNNVMKLFSTTSANGGNIVNYWCGKLSMLDVDELKKEKRLTIRGRIDPSQTIKVSLAFDQGDFVELGLIEGTGSYVNQETSAVLGGSMVGDEQIGGGGTLPVGNEYIREFNSELHSIMSKFYEVMIKFEALDVGYASVSEINHYDIKTYGQKNLLRYRTT